MFLAMPTFKSTRSKLCGDTPLLTTRATSVPYTTGCVVSSTFNLLNEWFYQRHQDRVHRNTLEVHDYAEENELTYRVGQKKLRQIFLAITLVNMDRF